MIHCLRGQNHEYSHTNTHLTLRYWTIRKRIHYTHIDNNLIAIFGFTVISIHWRGAVREQRKGNKWFRPYGCYLLSNRKHPSSSNALHCNVFDWDRNVMFMIMYYVNVNANVFVFIFHRYIPLLVLVLQLNRFFFRSL